MELHEKRRRKLVKEASRLTGFSEHIFAIMSLSKLRIYIDAINQGDIARPHWESSVERLEILGRRKIGSKSFENERIRKQVELTSEKHKRLLEYWGPTSKINWPNDVSLLVVTASLNVEHGREKEFIRIIDAPDLLRELARRVRYGDRAASQRFGLIVKDNIRIWAHHNAILRDNQEIKARSAFQANDGINIITYECLPTLKYVRHDVRIICIGDEPTPETLKKH